jgi:hypothetical protein
VRRRTRRSITYVHHFPPTLLIHGSADDIVPVEASFSVSQPGRGRRAGGTARVRRRSTRVDYCPNSATS